MSEEYKEKHFKPKAHILTLLGDELIKSPVMAIYELVKNSYDADARKVDVYFKDIESAEEGCIIVEDDGIGMTSEIIEEVWLEPGSDFRKPIDKTTGGRTIVKSLLYNRIPMGEKGVGRFAVHKLGNQILLISRPLIINYDENTKKIISKSLADYELQLYINWKDFNQSKHLSDVPIKWTIKKNPTEFRFKTTSGTYIRLSGLKENWTRGMARTLKSHTLSMLSPKIQEDSFKINLNFNNSWLQDFPTVDKILNEAPYKITALIDSNFNFIFEYEFKLSRNNEIGCREIKKDASYDKNVKGEIRAIYRTFLEKNEYDQENIEAKLIEFDEKKLPFGNILFEFHSYDLDSNSMRDYTLDATLVKKILKENYGVKVFKGDLRVYDYGEQNNDWLGLDLERIQNKEWFSNNQNIGYVYLDAENSGSLIEKTNREGFINNSAYQIFLLILKYILIEFKNARLTDRNRWLRFNQKASNKLFDNKISNFKALIEDSHIEDLNKKQKLIEEAESLEEKYEEDKKILLIPAGVGMTASVALHEIEKLVPRMEESLNLEPFRKERIKEQVEELKQYTEGIISVLRKASDKPLDLREATVRAFNNYKLKLTNRKIDWFIDISSNIQTIKCDKRFYITMLMNIIDNSIYWLDTVYKKEKLILFKALCENDKTIILVADNGPGFKDDINEMIRPFFSRKADGIGIGLYLIDTIMMKYGRLDIITDKEQKIRLAIPEKFDGAIIKLTFKT